MAYNPALRCSACSIDWPTLPDYNTCPKCQGPTWRMNDGDPIGRDEAKSIKSHADFERFYAEREAAREAEIKRLEQSLSAA